MRHYPNYPFGLTGLLACWLIFRSTEVSSQGFDLVRFATSDSARIEAAFFNVPGERAVIFAHGAVFSGKSWYFMAERLRENHIASLCIDFRGYGNSTDGSTGDKGLDITGAVDFLKAKGFTRISLVGGSMGGAAILQSLQARPDPVICSVVLLSPASSLAISSPDIRKLFVVSRDEGLYGRVFSAYTSSSLPKELTVYPGSAHAQHMFKEPYSDDLQELILSYLCH
ncbi:MAG: alpha/beta hydrolase [Cyclobacteriaceae bacterium]|nr:alpha/beta hydrolase [Cyclobacteriaceae bacterium]